MPTSIIKTRQQNYRMRLADAGRVALQVTVARETANLLKSIAAENSIPLGAALEAKLLGASELPAAQKRRGAR